MNKYVIYTVMAGKYGEVRPPLVIDDRFDYVLFSNDFKETNIGVWQVRSIPIPQDISPNDNKRLSRYPKTHPETMLSEYQASLYIDANIQIADKWVYERVIELAEQQVSYAGIKLLVSGQNCIYRHSFDMCARKIEHDYNALIQMRALRKNGFPDYSGLNENNIIYRRHNELMKQVDEEWWWWIATYSYRDQFSYMFCLWKYKVPMAYFLPVGEDAYNSEHFKITYHNDDPNVAKQKWIKEDTLEKWRNFTRNLTRKHQNHYREQWVWLTKRNHPIVWLKVLGVISFIFNLPLVLPIRISKLIKHRNK